MNREYLAFEVKCVINIKSRAFGLFGILKLLQTNKIYFVSSFNALIPVSVKL